VGTVTPLLTRLCWHCYPEDPFLPCLFKSGPCDSGKIFKDYITFVTYFTQAVKNYTVGKLERCRKGSFISLNAESDSLCPDSIILFIQSSQISSSTLIGHDTNKGLRYNSKGAWCISITVSKRSGQKFIFSPHFSPRSPGPFSRPLS